jgi:hypothetical protein
MKSVELVHPVRITQNVKILAPYAFEMLHSRNSRFQRNIHLLA